MSLSPSPYETPTWPASPDHLNAARQFLTSISSKEDDRPILIIPDRDVDGLSSGGIMQRVVSRILLKNPEVPVRTRFVSKGAWLGDAPEKAEVDAINPRYCFHYSSSSIDSHIIVLDQGSRGSPPLASNAEVLIIDHHLSTKFPEKAVICSACNHLPVATTSLLTFIVIYPFLEYTDQKTKEECEWLAVLGVKGDLGGYVWEPPFPSQLESKVAKSYTNKALSEAVSLLNARTFTTKVLTDFSTSNGRMSC